MPTRPWFTETLAIWLAARYFVASRLVSPRQDQQDWRPMRELCADVAELRRGSHRARRLRLDREILKFYHQRQHDKTKSEETPLLPRCCPARWLLRGKQDCFPKG